MNVQNALAATLTSASPEMVTANKKESETLSLDQTIWSAITSELGLPQEKSDDDEVMESESNFTKSSMDVIFSRTTQNNGNDSFQVNQVPTLPSEHPVNREQEKGGPELALTGEQQMIVPETDFSISFQGASTLPESSVARISAIASAASSENFSLRQVALNSSDGSNLHRSTISESQVSSLGPQVGRSMAGAVEGTIKSPTANSIDSSIESLIESSIKSSIESLVEKSVENSMQRSPEGSIERPLIRGEVRHASPLMIGNARQSPGASVDASMPGIPAPTAMAVQLSVEANSAGQENNTSSLSTPELADRVAGMRLPSELEMKLARVPSSELKLAGAGDTLNASTSLPLIADSNSFLSRANLQVHANLEVNASAQSASNSEVALAPISKAEMLSPQVSLAQLGNSLFDFSMETRHSRANSIAANWQSPDLEPTRAAASQLGLTKYTAAFSSTDPLVAPSIGTVKTNVEANAYIETGMLAQPTPTGFQNFVAKPLALQLGSVPQSAHRIDSNPFSENNHSTSFNGKAWSNDASQRISMMVSRNLESAEIQIDPPELGPISVRIAMHNDQLSLQFASPHGQVRDFIEQHMNQLERLLQDQGLELGNADVSTDDGWKEGGNHDAESDSPIIDEDEEFSAGKLTENPSSLSIQGNIDTFI